ncbi:MAG TPA: hypothetical protein VJN95_14520 [Gemmatimonadales bacterium]|nr:hypothetical protein [Gemmatimonadales bacterium]
MIRRAFRFLARAGLFAGFAGCHSASPANPYPTGYSLSPFRERAESVTVDSADRVAIYRTVLQFYRPTQQQWRWIDEETLPATPTDSVGKLPAGLATTLAHSMGEGRFCVQGGIPACPLHPTGGSLRVSPVYGLDSGRARVAVHFTGYYGTPYAKSSAWAGIEVFLVERQQGEWRIAAHAPAGK